VDGDEGVCGGGKNLLRVVLHERVGLHMEVLLVAFHLISINQLI
jgi:hypothetical protein